MSDILYVISSYAVFLPILIGLFRQKHLDTSLWWYLAGLLSISVCGIISLKLSEKNINNHFMMYVNACSIMILRTFFFYSFISSKNHKKALIICLFAYLAGVFVDIFIHGIYMNQYLFMVTNIWGIFFFLVCLNQILKDESIESLRELPIFWVVTGTLTFIVFDFFLVVANSWLNAINREFLYLLWDYITPIFMFIRIIFVSIGYWKTKKYAENLVKT